MNIVDSSGWLEYFKGSKNAKKFAKAIEDTENLLVPSIILYEVYKKLCQTADKQKAIQAIGHMQMAKIIGIHTNDALNAANFSKEFKLPMADALIYAVAYQSGATLWTQDADFKDLEGVKYFTKV
jgi:toxin FitB